MEAFGQKMERWFPRPKKEEKEIKNYRLEVIEESRRLLVRRCILICLTNGWAPPAETVWRLVELKEEWSGGRRQEDRLGRSELRRLRFAHWLYERNKISG